MGLRKIRDAYIDDGLDFQNATARTCRGVILALISTSRMMDGSGTSMDAKLGLGVHGKLPVENI